MEDNAYPLESNIVFGKNLSITEKDRITSLISQYVAIFAPNPKKPTLVTTMEHCIITDETQPMNIKPYRIPHT